MKKITVLALCLCLLTFALLSCAEEPVTNPNTVTYTVSVKGITLSVDAPSAGLIKALGEPNAFEESPSCAFEGMDKIYSYSGFEVETYCKNGIDYIAAIQLTDDSLTMEQGVTIGSSAEQVKAAYGVPSSESEAALIYQSDGVKLQFLLRQGKVTNVQLTNVRFSDAKTN